MNILLNEYQRWTRTTVQYPQSVEAAYIGYGLLSECGELAGALAKFHRGDYDVEEYKRRAKKELGDILWFLARYADFSGWELQEILEANVEKLEQRKTDNTIKGDGDDR